MGAKITEGATEGTVAVFVPGDNDPPPTKGACVKGGGSGHRLLESVGLMMDQCENFPCSLVKKDRCQVGTDAFRISGVTDEPSIQNPASIRGKDAPQQLNFSRLVVDGGVGPKGHLATTAKGMKEGPFRGAAGGRLPVVEHLKEYACCGVLLANLKPQCSLPRRGKEVGRRKNLTVWGTDLQPGNARLGEDDGVVFPAKHLVYTGGDVPPEVQHTGGRGGGTNHGAAAQAGCSDAGARWKAAPRQGTGGQEDIEGIFPCGHGGKVKTRGLERWDVLQAVNGDVYTFVVKGRLDFLGKDTLATNLRQGGIKNPVAGCLYNDQFHLQPGVCAAKGIDNTPCLKQGEAASPGSDAKGHLCGS